MATDYSAIHRSGVNNAGADARALFLKLYAGEVLTAFQSKNIMMPLHRVRTISKGKSAQFPLTGKYRDAAYHTPGAEIVPSASKQGERIVSVDDLLVNAQFVPNIDEAMSHYDIRSIYTQEAGFGLGKVADQNILRLGIKAALCETAAMAILSTGAPSIQEYSAFDDEDFSGNVVVGGDETTTSSQAAAIRDPKKITQALMDAKRLLTNKNVPGDPFIVMSNDMYYDMFKISGTSNLNDLAIFNRDLGGSGSVASGQVPTILGMPVYVTNHLGSYSNTAGTTWTSDLWTHSAGAVAVHETGTAPAWGDHQPLASSVGSGRTTQYDVGNTNHAAWITHVTNTQSVANAAVLRKTAYLSDVAMRVRALVMTQDAVATVKLMDLSVESEYQINRQGTLMVSKYAMGHNILRPACAVALLQAL
jgi:hypothetical protein